MLKIGRKYKMKKKQTKTIYAMREMRTKLFCGCIIQIMTFTTIFDFPPFISLIQRAMFIQPVYPHNLLSNDHFCFSGQFLYMIFYPKLLLCTPLHSFSACVICTKSARFMGSSYYWHNPFSDISWSMTPPLPLLIMRDIRCMM